MKLIRVIRKMDGTTFVKQAKLAKEKGYKYAASPILTDSAMTYYDVVSLDDLIKGKSWDPIKTLPPEKANLGMLGAVGYVPTHKVNWKITITRGSLLTLR